VGLLLGLINQQGVPFATRNAPSGVIRLNPSSGQQAAGSGGTETTANFNFFYLYTQPSTASALLPSHGSPGDITDENNNIETMISYDVLAQQPDRPAPATPCTRSGTGQCCHRPAGRPPGPKPGSPSRRGQRSRVMAPSSR
jgi:hypothetical protein